MKRFGNEELIDVYNDYDYKIYAPSSLYKGQEYVFEPKIDDEPITIRVPYNDIVYINRVSNLFKRKVLRFTQEFEQDMYDALRINFEKVEKDTFSREEIQNMILNPNSYGINGVINIIKEIKDKDVINRFIAELVSLKNENCYDISERLELYLKARKEELNEGTKISKLEVPEPKIQFGVEDKEENIEEVEETVNEDENKEVQTTKKTTTKRTTRNTRTSRTTK